MEKITLRRNVQIRNRSDLRIIDIHDSKLRRRTITPQARVIRRPYGFASNVVVRVGIGVEVGDEGDEPVFHVLCYGDVVDVWLEQDFVSGCSWGVELLVSMKLGWELTG